VEQDGLPRNDALDTETEQSSEATNGEMTDEQIFRAFVGPNDEIFINVYQKFREGKLAHSLNFVAFLASPIWLFYRKLYLFGIAILFLPIAIDIAFPALPDAIYTGFGVVMLMLANSFYVSIATRRIEKIKALGLPQADFKERLQISGGTSPVGAAFGTLIFGSVIALMFMS